MAKKPRPERLRYEKIKRIELLGRESKNFNNYTEDISRYVKDFWPRIS